MSDRDQLEGRHAELERRDQPNQAALGDLVEVHHAEDGRDDAPATMPSSTAMLARKPLPYLRDEPGCTSENERAAMAEPVELRRRPAWRNCPDLTRRQALVERAAGRRRPS